MNKILKISSKNNYFQHFEVLKRNRVKRKRHNEFFVEGVSSLNRLLESNYNIKYLLYSGEKNLSDWAKNILINSKAEKHFELTNELMDILSDKEDKSEIIAIVEMYEYKIEDIKFNNNINVLVFDRPSNYGNLGTIIRLCDSFRIDALIITGHSVDVYDPKTIRASVGAFFYIPIILLPSHKELISWISILKDKLGSDIKIVGSSARSDMSINNYAFLSSNIILIGNETYGLSNNYKNLCDDILQIPIYGKSSSINVACAASIILFELNKQKDNR